jgi:hypothetical protein
MYVPDNYDAWKANEARQARAEIREKRYRNEDIEPDDIPFYEEEDY